MHQMYSKFSKFLRIRMSVPELSDIMTPLEIVHDSISISVRDQWDNYLAILLYFLDRLLAFNDVDTSRGCRDVGEIFFITAY